MQGIQGACDWCDQPATNGAVGSAETDAGRMIVVARSCDDHRDQLADRIIAQIAPERSTPET